MRILSLLFCLAGAAHADVDVDRYAGPSSKAAIKQLFEKPLIIGASMSEDFAAPSPGRNLARALGTEAGVKSIAKASVEGADVLKEVMDADIRGASAVVALDLMYWDSYDWHGDGCKGALAAVDSLFDRVSHARKPLVIGTVPIVPSIEFSGVAYLPQLARYAYNQPCREAVNERIRDRCHKQGPTCHIYDLERIVAKKSLTDLYRQTAKDNFHPNQSGSDDLATELVWSLLPAPSIPEFLAMKSGAAGGVLTSWQPKLPGAPILVPARTPAQTLRVGDVSITMPASQ